MSTSSGNPSMAQRIAQAMPTLTESHRRVADYVLAHPLQVATLPIDELAATAGVSLATANRFARALGFDGYPQFRAALVLGFESTLAPVERLRSKLERPASVGAVFDSALAEIERNLAATRQSLDPEACRRAVEPSSRRSGSSWSALAAAPGSADCSSAISTSTATTCNCWRASKARRTRHA